MAATAKEGWGEGRSRLRKAKAKARLLDTRAEALVRCAFGFFLESRRLYLESRRLFLES